MATILLVDDDAELLERQGRAFRALPGQFELLTAHHGAEALPLLESRSLDLLIIDLQMPLMDGFELLTYAIPLQPDAHLILLSEVATELTEVLPDTPGSAELVFKPLAPGALLDRARTILARSTRGYLSGLSLSGLLQLIALEQRSVAITVRHGNRRGTIEMLDGQPVSAEIGLFKGSEAILEMLTWRDPEIEIVGSASQRPREMTHGLEALLMEAARIRDETRRASQGSLAGQWIERSSGSDRPPSPELTPKQLDTVNRLLNRVMLLQGARGVVLVDTRTGASLASEGHRLKSDLEKSAEHLTTLARTRQHYTQGRTGAVERLTVHLDHHLEILLPFAKLPWAIYFLGRKRMVDEQTVPAALERIAGKIRDTLTPRDPSDEESDSRRSFVGENDTVSPLSAGGR